MSRRTVLPLLLLAAAAVGCGRKLPPEAPLQVIPARVTPLRVAQQGSDVVLRFPYPSRTAQGAHLTNLTAVTVWREAIPAPPGAAPPGPAEDPEQRRRDEKLFVQRAEPLRVLSGTDLDAATFGSEVLVRDSLYPLAKDGRLGRVFLRYGVTATRDRKKVSALSPLVTLLPLVPPAEPLGLSATVEEGRVCLDWLPPQAMLDGTKPARVAGYAVYRRLVEDAEYDEPLTFVGKDPLAIDETVQPGRRYLYTVRAAPTAARPLVLGPPADEVLVDTADVFPPPAPEGLLVLREDAGSRLVWNPSLARDLAGYRVYGRDGGGAWRRLADGLTDPGYLDAGAPAGRRYAVTAVDAAGNESARAYAQAGREGR